jgi:hypothetical protein
LENLPKVSEEDWARVRAVKDVDIDFSDIPEIKDMSGFRLRPKREMHKPMKVAVNSEE